MDIIESYNQFNEFGRYIGMSFEIIEPGKTLHHIKINKDLLATKTALHGGVMAAFLDAVAGISALSLVKDSGKVVATIEYKVNFLKPVFLNDVLKGEGNVINEGKRIIVSEGKVYNQNGILVATAIGTFNAYPYEKMV